jgi:NAD(P)H-dependent FMN reductase
MSARERSVYKDTANNIEAVREYVERLRQAEGVIFVFPTWWYGMPAILKGYLDRVWLPGVAFEFGPQAIRPLLTNMRLLGVVTTANAPEWFTRIYMGNPFREGAEKHSGIEPAQIESGLTASARAALFKTLSTVAARRKICAQSGKVGHEGTRRTSHGSPDDVRPILHAEVGIKSQSRTLP